MIPTEGAMGKTMALFQLEERSLSLVPQFWGAGCERTRSRKRARSPDGSMALGQVVD